MTAGRTFDYVPRLDPRNLAYRVSAPPPDLLQRPRYWTPGPCLNQGSEGACVGFSCTAEALASPVRTTLNGYLHGSTTAERVAVADIEARDVYARAKEIDEWEGVDYEGTSVRAGMLVGRERGWWDGFRWALNMAELRAALEHGPVVLGVEWRSGMYQAPGGLLHAAGGVVGGHCILATGYTPRHRILRAPAYRLRNSWGREWGNSGTAYIHAAELDRILFQAGGEAAVPIGRKA